MTLYTFTKDSAGTSACYGKCAEAWPPLAADAGAAPVGDFSVVARNDGTSQWAYKGLPLYGWVRDKAPGGRDRRRVPGRLAGRQAVILSTVRLWTGLIVLLFVTCHLLNHAAGLISLAAMNAWTEILMDPWQTRPGLIILAGSMLLHIGVNMWTLVRRGSLQMSAWQITQYASGFILPVLLVGHIIRARVMVEIANTNSDYYAFMAFYWLVSPALAIQQVIALLITWLHGLLGLMHWLKVKPWFRPWRGVMAGLIIAIPTVSLAGFVSAGNQMLREARGDPEYADFIFGDANWTVENAAQGIEIATRFNWIYIAILASVLVWRLSRRLLERLSRAPRLTYADGRVMAVPSGATILETVQINGIDHAAVCGGRGRCTTCRVMVRDGIEQLDEPETIEAKALMRIDAAPGVRLACQVRPVASLSVMPLLAPTATTRDVTRKGHLVGREQIVTVLFVDLRGSTGLGEVKLPFDTLFILNQFFAEMIQALRASGGHYANFTGDGLMALYGLEGSVKEGCTNAVRGAGLMLDRLGALNQRLEAELPQPLRIGVGVHTGEAIVGEMGPPDARLVSAIGDTVNTAARLEGVSKEVGRPIVVSGDTVSQGSLALPQAEIHEIQVRGRQQPVQVHAIAQVPEALSGQ